MKNNLSVINDIDCIRLELARLRANGIQSLYRGQSDVSWKITSSLKRIQGDDTIEELWSKYESSFAELSTQLKKREYLKYKPEKEDVNFYLLSIARHLGFPCNLIDWTSSLDMALYAACHENFYKDGCLFIISGNLKINEGQNRIDPFKIKESVIVCKDFDFFPDECGLTDLPLARKRRFRQNGFFSIISKADTEMDYEYLLPDDISIHKIIIPNTLKSEVIDLMQRSGRSSEWYLLDNQFADASRVLTYRVKSKYLND